MYCFGFWIPNRNGHQYPETSKNLEENCFLQRIPTHEFCGGAWILNRYSDCHLALAHRARDDGDLAAEQKHFAEATKLAREDVKPFVAT